MGKGGGEAEEARQRTWGRIRAKFKRRAGCGGCARGDSVSERDHSNAGTTE